MKSFTLPEDLDGYIAAESLQTLLHGFCWQRTRIENGHGVVEVFEPDEILNWRINDSKGENEGGIQ